MNALDIPPPDTHPLLRIGAIAALKDELTDEDKVALLFCAGLLEFGPGPNEVRSSHPVAFIKQNGSWIIMVGNEKA